MKNKVKGKTFIRNYRRGSLEIRRIVHVVGDPGLSKIAEGLQRHGLPADNASARRFQEWSRSQSFENYKQYLMEKRLAIQKHFDELQLILPNGRKGEPYSQIIDLSAVPADGFRFEGLTELGLSFKERNEPGKFEIFGTPNAVGDFSVNVIAEMEESDGVEVNRRIPVAFNSDPRDLWKNLEVPADTLFRKPDVDFETIKVFGEATLVAASRRGRSHANVGSPRDDDFSISHISKEGITGKDGWYVIAVADGAGSAKYSREGSRIACVEAKNVIGKLLEEKAPQLEDAVRKYQTVLGQDTAVEYAVKVTEIINDVLRYSAYECHKKIRSFSCTCGDASMRDFNTTLLLSICRRFDFGWFVASYWVGDGAIGILIRNGENGNPEVRLLGISDGGEFAGQTRFVTMASTFTDRTRTRFTIVKDLTALMLMTDGVSDPWFETDANLSDPKKWENLWKDITSAVNLDGDPSQVGKELAEWLDFYSKSNHDDRTIAILY